MTHQPYHDLTAEEVEAIISAIHYAQDAYQGAADELAHATSEEDRYVGRALDKRQPLLDSARKKLGDTWNPHPDFQAPDTPEGLTS
jgi:hypothetical protein